MTDRLPALLAEFADLQARLADPSAHADPSTARSLGRRYAEITPVVELARELDALRGDLDTARELVKEDASFGADVDALTARVGQAESRLRELLVPRDPNDGKDVIIEIKAGEGGAESALFAADLLRMYQRYAERAGFTTEILSSVESELGGVRGVSVAVKAGRNSAAGPWRRLKYEGGVHRVQRVPVTESAGRIHTSAAGVLVMPEAEEVEVTIDPGDLKVDVFRSSGPGGQSVNTTDSAVRITHLPTGTVVSMQNEKSQIQNRAAAMRVLRARLLSLAESERAAERSAARRSQVRTVDRSERVRTYNFPENRISDHRVGYKSHNLDQVLDGDLDAVVDALIVAETALAAGRSAHAGDERGSHVGRP